jgi:hypothetical protein
MQLMSSDRLSFSAESLPEDDVDRLFQKLQKHEPPADIVKQVLARVRQLPAAQRYPRPLEQLCPVPDSQQDASD